MFIISEIGKIKRLYNFLSFFDFFIDFFARWLTTLIGLAGVFSKLAAKPFGTTGGDFETGGRRGSTIGLAMATIGDGTIGRGGASSVAWILGRLARGTLDDIRNHGKPLPGTSNCSERTAAWNARLTRRALPRLFFLRIISEAARAYSCVWPLSCTAWRKTIACCG